MKTKSLVTIISIYICAGLVVACASKPKESKNETLPAASAGTKAGPSTADVRDRYTMSQLDGAGTALKIISSVAADPKADGGTEIIGCPLAVGKARSMAASLKYLIEGRLSSEREAYSSDPTQYGDSNSFETCATACSCGVLSSVIRGARTSGLKGNDLKYHDRWVARLKLKASAIGEREERACAARQTWLCGSDLLSYLESQAAGGL
ncbi:MAG: hypothetical protein AAB250_08080 [Bdellovibrionota bacterium]